MSDCPRCVKRGKTWNGGDPVCGFPEGVFDVANWNCATLNELRDLAEGLGVRQRSDDQSAALIPCGFVETSYDPNAYVQDEEGWPYVVLEWYKNRGRTEGAWELNGSGQPSILRLETAETILRHARASA